jgi:predicted nucleic acid-binding protein
VKLVLPESETAALLEELDRWPSRVSSIVAAVEVRLAARRSGASTELAEAVVSGLALLPLDDRVVGAAAGVSPALRALDAIHLASALSIQDELAAFCCYDGHLSEAASSAGLSVIAPGS